MKNANNLKHLNLNLNLNTTQAMTKILPVVGFVLAIATTSPAYANKALAQSKNCLSCHGMEKKLIGPAIKAIAEKYPEADAEKIAALAKKVREGGVGVWGSIPMASNPQVTPAESETLVKWFLASGN
jgi:cytochrome c